MVFGDLNKITKANEKNGGNPIDKNLIDLICNTFYDCLLNDMGFMGHIKTWCNNQEGKFGFPFVWFCMYIYFDSM